MLGEDLPMYFINYEGNNKLKSNAIKLLLPLPLKNLKLLNLGKFNMSLASNNIGGNGLKFLIKIEMP